MISAVKQIGERGEIVIPKEIREEKGLDVNSKVEIISTKKGIIIIPLKKKMKALAGLFETKEAVNFKELDALTHELLAGI